MSSPNGCSIAKIEVYGYAAPATVNVTANSDGESTPSYWATYYNGTTSFTADANTTVYQAAVSSDKKKVQLTEVADKVIPASEGVILKSSSSSITLTPATTTATLSGNELTGTDAALVNPGNAYCLSKGTSGIGFYKFTADGTIPANRAYLVISGATARGFIGFGDDDATAIDAVKAINDDAPLYELSGRRVTGQPQKGIYVKNGKKMIIK